MVEQTELALKVTTHQIFDELLSDGDADRSISCALIPDWNISHSSGQISIRGPSNISTDPKIPPWLDYEKPDQASFHVSTEVDPYLNDFIGLILESWRVGEKNHDYTSEDSLREALEKIAKRWKMSGDPLDQRKQKELIGELKCVADAYQIRGAEAIDSWDMTGHSLYDLDSETWVIESKATSSEPESVILSKPEQVDFRIKKILVLGVTSLNQSKTSGVTFPEKVTEILSVFEKSDRQNIELRLMNRGYSSSPELDKKFTTLWRVNGTRYLPITENSNVLPCSWIDDRPDTILNITQRLATEGFPESELQDLIG